MIKGFFQSLKMGMVALFLLTLSAGCGLLNNPCNGLCSDCPSRIGRYCTGSVGSTCYYCEDGYVCGTGEKEGKCINKN